MAEPPSFLPSSFLIECRVVGHLLRVTAIDPVTGREAVVQGPASAGAEAVKRLAVQKLIYLLNKKD